MAQTLSVKIHPAAEIFPPMSEECYEKLKADIQKHGQLEKAVLLEGKIIDGRHRARACDELGIELEACEFESGTETNPFDYVISANLHRRHLSTSQRSLVAGKLATLKHGGDRTSEESKVSDDTLIQDAADLLNVGRATVCRAKTVLDKGSKALIEAIETGKATISRAAKIVAEQPDKAKQAAKLEEPKEKKSDDERAMAAMKRFKAQFGHLRGLTAAVDTVIAAIEAI